MLKTSKTMHNWTQKDRKYFLLIGYNILCKLQLIFNVLKTNSGPYCDILFNLPIFLIKKFNKLYNSSSSQTQIGSEYFPKITQEYWISKKKRTERTTLGKILEYWRTINPVTISITAQPMRVLQPTARHESCLDVGLL